MVGEEHFHVEITEDVRIRFRPCDACLRYKFIGFWNRIEIRRGGSLARLYYACSSGCQFTVLMADKAAYPLESEL